MRNECAQRSDSNHRATVVRGHRTEPCRFRQGNRITRARIPGEAATARPLQRLKQLLARHPKGAERAEMAVSSTFSASGAALAAALKKDGLVRVVSARDLKERFRYLLQGAYLAVLCGDSSLLAVAATHGTVSAWTSSFRQGFHRRLGSRPSQSLASARFQRCPCALLGVSRAPDAEEARGAHWCRNRTWRARATANCSCAAQASRAPPHPW